MQNSHVIITQLRELVVPPLGGKGLAKGPGQRRYDNPSPTRHAADGKLNNVNICGAQRTYTRVRVGTGRGLYSNCIAELELYSCFWIGNNELLFQ